MVTLFEDITPCPRWCQASGNAQHWCAVFPAACRPPGSLSAPSPSRRVQTAWRHRLVGSPTCTAMSKGKDGEKNQQINYEGGFSAVQILSIYCIIQYVVKTK